MKTNTTLIIIGILILAVFILPKLGLFVLVGYTCPSDSSSIGQIKDCYREGYSVCKQMYIQDKDKSTRCYKISLAYSLNGNILNYYTSSRNLFLYESETPIQLNCNLGSTSQSGRYITCSGSSIIENYDSTNGINEPYTGQITLNKKYNYLVATDKGKNSDTDKYYGGIVNAEIIIGGCTPSTCSALGKNCGSWSDNCGGTLNCGSCSTGYTCSNGVCVSSGCPTFANVQSKANSWISGSITFQDLLNYAQSWVSC